MHFSIAENTRFSLDGALWSVMEYNCADKAAPQITARRTPGSYVDTFTLDRFSELYLERRIQFVEIEGSNRPVSPKLTNPASRLVYKLGADELKQMDERMGYVLAVTKDKTLISCTKERLQKIREHALEVSAKKMPSDATVRRWHARWRAYNCENAAVIAHKGGNRKQRIEEAVENYVSAMINDEYMGTQRISVPELHDRIRRGMKADPILCEHDVPSPKTIYRRVNDVPKYDRVAARKGWDIAQQQFPSGMPVRQPRYPFERFELDHTPIDLVVVDAKTGRELGRAWATFLIDAYTRMVVGFFISLKAPSRKSVVAALKHAISPKTYVKQLYPDIQSEYPCWGTCSLIAVDNGRDLHANDAKRVMAELNIIIQYCPRKRPNYKGKIERFLKRFNYEFIHTLPGTTFANYIEKGDYKETAVISLELLTELIHRWVIDDYHNEPHRTLGISPLEFWNQNRHAFSNPVLFDSVDRLDQLMWTEFTGSIQKDGVAKHNLYWNSKELQDIAKKQGRKGNQAKIEVLLDEDDLSMARVRVPGTDELIDVPNTKPDYTKNLSLYMHEQIRKGLIRDHGARYKFTEQALMTARRKSEELVATAAEVSKSKLKQSPKGPASATSSDDVINTVKPKPKQNATKKPAPKSAPDVEPIIFTRMEVD